jgi:flagellar motor switch protein FliG
MLPQTLRKAAILIQALDEATAESLLDQMGSEAAAKVRMAVMELDSVPVHEEQAILAEFLGRQDAPQSPGDDGVELSLTSEPDLATADINRPSALPAPPGPGFSFLERVPPTVLARELASEQPQAIAAVLANLSPEQAAGVLQLLPSALATDALERMATIDQVPREVLSDLETELRTRLGPHMRVGPASARSIAHLTSVLAAMEMQPRERFAFQLAKRNTELANRLGLTSDGHSQSRRDPDPSLRYRIDSFNASAGPQGALGKPDAAMRSRQEPAPADFANLADLNDHLLRGVLAAADTRVLVLALSGADQRLIDRVLRVVPPREARELGRLIAQPGPVRLRDIDAAQRELAELASSLARPEIAGHFAASV